MEAKQLSYFISACRSGNNVTAAKELGIANSTLSTSFSLLEEELGLCLMKRTSDGFYPTKMARAIYQDVETILQDLDRAGIMLANSNDKAIIEIPIYFSLPFTFALLSTKINNIICQVMTDFPEVRFPVVLNKYEGQEHPHGHIEIGYYPYDKSSDNNTLVQQDRLLLVSNIPLNLKKGAETGSISPDILNSADIKIPVMPEALRKFTQRYCSMIGLKEVTQSEMEIGCLPRKFKMADPLVFIVPESAVSLRFRASRMYRYNLPSNPQISIQSRIKSTHIAAETLGQLLSTDLIPIPVVRKFNNYMTLRQVYYFLICYEQGNITGASNRLLIAQPALSNQLNRLEKKLGVDLFERSRKGLLPTQAGKIFYEIAQSVDAAIERIKKTAKDLSLNNVTQLVIGAIPIFDSTARSQNAIAKAVMEWRKSFPKTELKLIEASRSELESWLREGRINAAILDVGNGQGTRFELGLHENLGFVFDPGKVNLPSNAGSSTDLMGLKFVLPSAGYGIRDMVSAHFGKKLTDQIEFTINSFQVSIEMIKGSELVTILPQSDVEKYLVEQKLGFVPISNANLGRRLFLRFSAERALTEAERVLVKLLCDSFQRKATNEGLSVPAQ